MAAEGFNMKPLSNPSGGCGRENKMNAFYM